MLVSLLCIVVYICGVMCLGIGLIMGGFIHQSIQRRSPLKQISNVVALCVVALILANLAFYVLISMCNH